MVPNERDHKATLPHTTARSPSHKVLWMVREKGICNYIKVLAKGDIPFINLPCKSIYQQFSLTLLLNI